MCFKEGLEGLDAQGYLEVEEEGRAATEKVLLPARLGFSLGRVGPPQAETWLRGDAQVQLGPGRHQEQLVRMA